MAETCTHTEQIRHLKPKTHSCEECVKMGDTWVHLRLCEICGHVGCCDSSKNKHATKHFRATKTPHREVHRARRVTGSGAMRRRSDVWKRDEGSQGLSFFSPQAALPCLTPGPRLRQEKAAKPPAPEAESPPRSAAKYVRGYPPTSCAIIFAPMKVSTNESPTVRKRRRPSRPGQEEIHGAQSQNLCENI